jgi:hypothetical protein
MPIAMCCRPVANKRLQSLVNNGHGSTRDAGQQWTTVYGQLWTPKQGEAMSFAQSHTEPGHYHQVLLITHAPGTPQWWDYWAMLMLGIDATVRIASLKMYVDDCTCTWHLVIGAPPGRFMHTELRSSAECDQPPLVNFGGWIPTSHPLPSL